MRALNKSLDATLTPNSFEYGDVFEHFLILEIKRLVDYKKSDWTFSYLMTKDIDNCEGYVLSQDPIEQKKEGVWFLPWQKGLSEIGLV